MAFGNAILPGPLTRRMFIAAIGGIAVPRVFDNIDLPLLSALQDTLHISDRADFCIGYFNLRGWRLIDSYVDQWAGGEDSCCRLLIGMQPMPQDELRSALSLTRQDDGISQGEVSRLRQRVAEEFCEQLTLGMPTAEDERGLRRLSAQLKAGKVVVKVFLRHSLHAKLYLLHRIDPNNPTIGFVGSSNLTLAGLAEQGELNVDVLDHDACIKLQTWFDARWSDRWCVDISEELIRVIDESWAREEAVPPYHIYLNMAYHLSREARAGLSEFRIPSDFGDRLWPFQSAAVRIAAHHLNKRGGVLIGDVVGLGKTLMATAVARIFQEDQRLETLVICPKNLVPMWEDYFHRFRVLGQVMSISRAIRELPQLWRYRLLILDESQNLRNPQTKTYRAIKDYIQKNECRCILLSATPYNKTYLDLSAQLALFVEDDRDLGIRPERLIRELGETEFLRRHQCPVRSLAAFEKSDYADDWRDLMRLFMVRRTRGFIVDNYAETDADTGRKYLTMANGERSYFPERKPRTAKFTIDDDDSTDQYARLYARDVVDTVNRMHLPRYGLGNYIAPSPDVPPTPNESKALQDLSRAGKRLMGFCRTNLFKRLESSGQAFIQSVERHILRNYVFLHAIETGQPLPIGTQGAEVLDARIYDEDADAIDGIASLFDDGDDEQEEPSPQSAHTVLHHEEDLNAVAAQVYADYAGPHHNRFRWLRSDLFVARLAEDLRADAEALCGILRISGNWDPARDAKLQRLHHLVANEHPNEKVIIFTQFADTVRYLVEQLDDIDSLAGVTGGDANPAEIAWRFSPVSNDKRDRVAAKDELRVLVATDVLSEGMNLQDCAIVVNFDLPWAIIRLIQRAGRVDRIGQTAPEILCYSFLPADGVERIINLRGRVRQRLEENAEVVGTDEAFFEDDADNRQVLDLYHEKSGILDGDADSEVDLASYAYQVWKNAIDRDKSLERTVSELPNVIYSSRAHVATEAAPSGVLLYVRTAEGNDSLAWIDRQESSVTQSQLRILQAAQCEPDTPAMPRHPSHFCLLQRGVEHLIEEEKSIGGQLGRPSGARFRTYERLKHYAERVQGTLFDTKELRRAINDIYQYPLRQSAIDALNRQLKSGIDDAALSELVIALHEEDRLCIIHEEEQDLEPRIICSMGLFGEGEGA